jgi:hypothetical protein
MELHHPPNFIKVVHVIFLQLLSAMLWHTEADTENGIYRCVNRYAETLPQTA